jgi:mRNA interferase HigB
MGPSYFTCMRIIARRTLQKFASGLEGHKDHRAVKNSLDPWFAEVSQSLWVNSRDVKRLYASASIVNVERIVFNIKGDDCRLVIAVDFKKAIVWIKWIGAHRDYDKIEVTKVEHDE